MKRLIALLVSSVLVLGCFMSGNAVEFYAPDKTGKLGQHEELNGKINDPISELEEEVTKIDSGISSNTPDGLPNENIIPANYAIPITSDNVRFYGRRIDTDEYIQAINSNSGIEARFIGTGLKLRIYGPSLGVNDVPFVQVWIDGERADRIQILSGDNDYMVASNLEYGEHIVKVLLVTEIKTGANGALKFKTIQVLSNTISAEGDKSGLLPPVYDEDQLVMDFYGDSITCGYGTIPGYPSGFRTRDQDSSTTYAFNTAAYFNADANYHCRSGWSIYQSYGSLRGVIPRVWNYVGIEDERPWPVENRPTDIVVVALGTNDAWTWNQIPTDLSVFTSTYVEFLKNMRKSYPDAYFICVHGMMDETFNSLVKDAAVEFSRIDPIGATFLKMPNMNGSTAFTGSGGHPSGEFGGYASTFLIDTIEKYYYKEWQYKLMCAADQLLQKDYNGWYSELLEIAYATAKDHNATGRNPKRLYYEVLDALQDVEDYNEEAAVTLLMVAAMASLPDSTDDIKHSMTKLAFAYFADYDDPMPREEAKAALKKMQSAVQIARAGGDLTGLVPEDGLLGAMVDIFTPDGDSRAYPMNGDVVSVMLMTTDDIDSLSATVSGDKFRSSKRGKTLDLSNVVIDNEANGVKEYFYEFEYKTGMEKLQITDGKKTYTYAFDKKPPVGELKCDLIPEFVSDMFKQINTNQAIKAVHDNAETKITNIALVGSFDDADAAHLSAIWENVYGKGSTYIDVYSCGGLEACYYASDIKYYGGYDLVVVELSAKESSSEAKQIYESFIRSILDDEEAPAVLCIGQASSKGAYAEHKEVADYYGLPYIDLNDIVGKAVAAGKYDAINFKREDGEASVIMNGVAVETIALAVIGDAYKDVDECEFPETSLTPAKFTNFELLTPEDIEVTKISNLEKKKNEDGDWVWYSEGGAQNKGILKFNLENYECVGIVFRDLSENNSASILGKFAGKNKANTFTYFPDGKKKAFLLYSGNPATDECSITATFKGPAEIYGFLVQRAPGTDSEE